MSEVSGRDIFVAFQNKPFLKINLLYKKICTAYNNSDALQS